MLTNAVITIFNKFPDRAIKQFIYVPHFLREVWFHTKQKTTVGESGLVSADEYAIRIPFPCEGWLPPNDFKDLSEPGENWTVQNGDFFLIGEWKGGSVSGINDVRKEFHGVVGTVLSHSENFFGTAQHIRIGGGS